MKQEIRSHVVGNVDFILAIQIEVENRHSQPLAVGDRDAHLFGDITKPPIAEIQEEPIIDRVIVSRPAITGDSTKAALLAILRRDIQVIHHEEIELVIVVDIQPDDARPPAIIPRTRFGSHIREGSVAEIVQQGAGPITGHIQVFKPIAIKIADGTALSITAGASGRDPRDLRKGLAPRL